MDSGAVQYEESQDTHVTSQAVQAVKVSLCYFAAQADEDVVIVVVVAVVIVVIPIVVAVVVLGILGLGIGCNFMIDNQLQPTDPLSIIISLSHFCSNRVLEV